MNEAILGNGRKVRTGTHNSSRVIASNKIHLQGLVNIDTPTSVFLSNLLVGWVGKQSCDTIVQTEGNRLSILPALAKVQECVTISAEWQGFIWSDWAYPSFR